MQTLSLGPPVKLTINYETLYLEGGTHANLCQWGLQIWATKRCAERGARMRNLPLGPSVEIPMGRET
eukprot:7650808-Pyramimonas_sp.AAC.1